MKPDSLLRHVACQIFSPAALARRKYAAFKAFCRRCGLQEEIEKKLADLDIGSAASLDETSKRIVSAIRNAPLPPALEDAVAASYSDCCRAVSVL